MMKLKLFTTVALLSLFFTQCAHITNFSGAPVTRYHRLEARMTKEKKYFGLAKVKYLTSATYRSQALREAYVEEYAKKYALSPEKKEELLQKERAEAQMYETFLVSHYSTDKDAAKITEHAKVWRLSLVLDSETEIDLHSVKKLNSRDSVLRYFYPQINNWSNVYLIKFKRQGDPTNLDLRMIGVVGDLSFQWKQKN